MLFLWTQLCGFSLFRHQSSLIIILKKKNPFSSVKLQAS